MGHGGCDPGQPGLNRLERSGHQARRIGIEKKHQPRSDIGRATRYHGPEPSRRDQQADRHYGTGRGIAEAGHPPGDREPLCRQGQAGGQDDGHDRPCHGKSEAVAGCGGEAGPVRDHIQRGPDQPARRQEQAEAHQRQAIAGGRDRPRARQSGDRQALPPPPAVVIGPSPAAAAFDPEQQGRNAQQGQGKESGRRQGAIDEPGPDHARRQGLDVEELNRAIVRQRLHDRQSDPGSQGGTRHGDGDPHQGLPGRTPKKPG